MVKIKNSPGDGCPNCCCSDCGWRGDAESSECCHCLPYALVASLVINDGSGSDPDGPCDADCECVTTGGGQCSCVDGAVTLTWDDTKCAWTGTIACGNLSVDLEVDVQKCAGKCYLCAKSTCLPLTGDCDITLFGCVEITDCGDYKRNCMSRAAGTADQTIILSFDDNPSGCGDTNCTDASLTIKAIDYINPQPSPIACCDCDCVCECVCVEYTEEGCIERAEVCWDATNEWWQVTFTPTIGCSWSSQTLKFELEECSGSDTCCWKLTPTRGTVNAPASQAAECPDPDITWTVDVGESNATVRLFCGGCYGDCCDRDLPATLYARICSASCNDFCVPLALISETTTETCWRTVAPVTVECPDSTTEPPPYPCEEYDIEIEFCCLIVGQSTNFEIRIYCSGTLVETKNVTVQCTPLCASGLVTPGSDANCNFPGVCAEGLTICISEAACP